MEQGRYYEISGLGLSRTAIGRVTRRKMVESLMVRLVCPECRSNLYFKVLEFHASDSSTSINYYYRCKNKECELNNEWQERGMPDLRD